MNWLDSATEAGVQGFLHCNELDRLVELAEGRNVIEIGAFCGLSAWGMAHTATHVTSIDTFKADTGGQNQQDAFTTLEEYDRVTAGFKNVSRLPFSSERACEIIPSNASFDMIFIDAMHTVEDVKADILRWWPRVNDGGVMCLHDYGHHSFPGVKQAADEVFGETTSAFVTVTLREVWKSSR